VKNPGGRLLILELNEITWDLVDPLMERGLLPNFRALAEGGVRAAPWASEQPQHLDPWITWTTLYTGVPQEVHRLSMLEQDRETRGAPMLWDYLRDAGLRLGLFGSANSWPPQPVDGFWVPGGFSRDFATYPRELEPIQALNIGLTRGHTAGASRPSLKSLAPKLLRLGLAPGTMLQAAREMAGIKLNGKTRWKMVALQPVINFDFFSRLYRQYQPHFATFHSNHVAYYMHRFWRAMDPTPFEVPPTEEERATYGRCVEHGYVVADRLLGRLRRLAGPDVTLAVLSSCGQQPAVGGRYAEDQRNGHVGLQLRIKTLLETLRIADRVEYSNLMAPQWKLDFQDPALLERTARELTEAWNVTRDVPAFSVHVEGRSMRLGAHRNQDLEDTVALQTPEGARQFKASELVERHAEVVKTGRHHPKGVMLMHGPAVRPGVRIEQCDNLDLAPTLLRVLGQPVPRIMEGRVLEEALLEKKAERTLAAV
jgi:hypothetical protein